MLIKLIKVSTVQGYDMFINNIKVNNVHKLASFIDVKVEDLVNKIESLTALRIIKDEIYVPTMVSCRVLADKLNEIPRIETNRDDGFVFLDGTSMGSTWMKYIEDRLVQPTFNPVVDVWNEENQLKELEMRDKAKYKLTVITPQMKSVYSIAETIEDAILHKERCIFCYLKEHNGVKFDIGNIKSLDMVCNMIRKHGGTVLDSLDEVVEFLNFKNKLYFNENYYITIEIEK